MGETRGTPDTRATDSVPFSILERIDVGETTVAPSFEDLDLTLSVSSNGSTWVKLRSIYFRWGCPSLSVSSNGSTWVKLLGGVTVANVAILSVSSNGSTWVKLQQETRWTPVTYIFQYPRTDRRG